MDTKRIIPCLDIKDGQTVKGVNFINLRTIGDPVEMAQKYEKDGADELVFLDISATVEGRKCFFDLIKDLAAHVTIPFTVGGGIASVDDVSVLIGLGASGVSINSAAVNNPQLINDIVKVHTGKKLVVAIDAKLEDGEWKVVTHGGNKVSDKDLFAWVRETEERGAGQILFTSMEHDGTNKGYPVELFAKLKETVSIPIIASGGAGSIQDIADVLSKGKADAALAAGIFHYGTVTIPELKQELLKQGIKVKI